MARLRGRVAWFLLGTAIVMGALPAINVARHGGLPASPPALFDTGFAWPAVSGALRRAGISTRPQQVIVGKSGWLFLGDQYAQAITAKRRQADAHDVVAANRSAAAIRAWAHWLQGRGIEDFHVLVCADKDAVYPDFLPDWDRPIAGSALDVMLARADPRIVVDSRPALRQARAVAGPALYLQTDSHWTARGAWIAYRALARSQDAGASGVAWLRDEDVRLLPTRLPSGDLARVLQVSDTEGDPAVVAEFAQARDARRTQADAISGEALDASALAGVEAPAHPLLIRSPHALNARRMLWLRDSFGGALLPYLAATYSEIIEVDRQATTPARLADLVRRFKPDGVLVTVVERNARADWFQALPPASTE